jgi:hypothetical protein
MMGTPCPWSQKPNFCRRDGTHARKLIPPAGMHWDSTVKVGGKSAQWLWRTKENTHGHPCPCAWAPPAHDPKKQTFAGEMETPPKVNTICGHILGLYCESLEEIGPAVMENEGKYAWAPCPSDGHPLPMPMPMPYGHLWITFAILIRFRWNFQGRVTHGVGPGRSGQKVKKVKTEWVHFLGLSGDMAYRFGPFWLWKSENFLALKWSVSDDSKHIIFALQKSKVGDKIDEISHRYEWRIWRRKCHSYGGENRCNFIVIRIQYP